MSHKPENGCEGCRHVTPAGRCTNGRYQACPRWRSWFRREWGAIRKAAAAIKKNNERGGVK